MKREFLEALGIDKEIVDKIMTENGNDINKTKEKLEAERDNYKSQLETAQTALKDFEGVDVKELKGKIDTLTADLTAKETDYQSKLTDMEFNSKLESLITSTGAKNSKVVKALLDLDSLKTSKNQDADLKTALETVKTENGYMFGSDEPFVNPIVAPIGGKPPTTLSGVEAAFLARNPDLKI